MRWRPIVWKDYGRPAPPPERGAQRIIAGYRTRGTRTRAVRHGSRSLWRGRALRNAGRAPAEERKRDHRKTDTAHAFAFLLRGLLLRELCFFPGTLAGIRLGRLTPFRFGGFDRTRSRRLERLHETSNRQCGNGIQHDNDHKQQKARASGGERLDPGKGEKSSDQTDRGQDGVLLQHRALRRLAKSALLTAPNPSVWRDRPCRAHRRCRSA